MSVMTCPSSSAGNVTPITCALSILELSQRELGAESDTLLVSRDFINRAIFKKATQFLKDGNYIFVSTKGTRILQPFTNLRTLKEAILKNFPSAKALSPLPQLSPQYYEKKHQHKTRKNAIHLRDNPEGDKGNSLRGVEYVMMFGQRLKVDENTLIFG